MKNKKIAAFMLILVLVAMGPIGFCVADEKIPAPKPILTVPLNGAIIPEYSNVTLQWTASGIDILLYDLSCYSDAQLTHMIYTTQVGSVITGDLRNWYTLEVGDTYDTIYWRVRVCYNLNTPYSPNCAFSDPGSFNILRVPRPMFRESCEYPGCYWGPNDVGRVGGSSAVLCWSNDKYDLELVPITFADQYRVQVSNSVNFDILVAESVVTDLKYTTPDLPPGDYYWRIRSETRDGIVTGWSTPRQFTVLGSFDVELIPDHPQVKQGERSPVTLNIISEMGYLKNVDVQINRGENCNAEGIYFFVDDDYGTPPFTTTIDIATQTYTTPGEYNFTIWAKGAVKTVKKTYYLTVSEAPEIPTVTTTGTSSPTPTLTETPTPTPIETATPTPEEGVDRGCIIATSTFGSVLAPEVQFLRTFREETVYSTFAGANFMAVFNAWYYSWSPTIAAQIWQSPALQAIGRPVLTPLLSLLHVSTMVNSLFNFNPEVGIVVAGLTACILIGAVYFTLPTLLPLYALKRRGRRLPKVKHLSPLLIPWTASILMILLGELSTSPLLTMAATGTFVIFTIALTAGTIALKAIQHLPR